MLADETTIDAVVEALALVGSAPVVVDPVMVVRERGDAAGPQREGGADRAHPAAGDGGHAEPARGARLAGLGEGATQRSWPCDPCPRAAVVIVTGGHSDDGADVLFEARPLRIDGPHYPAAPPTVGMHPLVGAGGVPRP